MASRITLSLREYRDGDLAGAWYAIAATDDARVNAAVVAEADRQRIFCVRADIAVEGSAVTPASFDYAGLSVGVLAGGEHRRSAAIRSAIREALQQGRDHRGERRRRARRGGAGRRRTRRSGTDHRPRPAAAGPGRCRRRRSAGAAGAARRAAPARRGDRRRQDSLRARDGSGRHQRRHDRAGPRRDGLWCASKGATRSCSPADMRKSWPASRPAIPVTVVPGVTSAIAVPASAGVPVTHRGLNHEFVVVSGHLAPEHPESLVNWDALAAMSGTIVLLMAVERIELFAEVLLKGGRPADTPVLVVQHGTTAAEHTLRATLADVAGKDPIGGNSTSRDHRDRYGSGIRRLKDS